MFGVGPLGGLSKVLVLLFSLTLCNPMDCSTPDFPILRHLLEFAQNVRIC